jgi:hypothetical protein
MRRTWMLINSALATVGAAIAFAALPAVANANSSLEDLGKWSEWDTLGLVLLLFAVIAVIAVIVGIILLVRIANRRRNQNETQNRARD